MARAPHGAPAVDDLLIFSAQRPLNSGDLFRSDMNRNVGNGVYFEL